MEIIRMPVLKECERYAIDYNCIIFRYNNVLCLKAVDYNISYSTYKLIFYDINKRIYFDYCNIKKITDRYELEYWCYFEECHMFYILAIEEQTKQSTVIEINVENGSCVEKAIDIPSDDIINGYYYLMYNGEEMFVYNYDINTETYTYYNYTNNTYGLNIRDIQITGDIQCFSYVCKYENRIILNLMGKDIKIFDENACYVSFEKYLDIFLDICIDEKSIYIINDKELNKDVYIEEWVLNGKQLIFSENPDEEENCSGLERYYSYDLQKKKLKELDVGDKRMICCHENHDNDLYVCALGDDNEILRLSDMKMIYKKDVFNAIKELDEEILKHITSTPDYDDWEEWSFNDDLRNWWHHTCFFEAEGNHGQMLLIEIDTMKAYISWEKIIGIIEDTIYIMEKAC